MREGLRMTLHLILENLVFRKVKTETVETVLSPWTSRGHVCVNVTEPLQVGKSLQLGTGTLSGLHLHV